MPFNDYIQDLTPAERVGSIAVRLYLGEQLTPSQIVNEYAVSRTTAYRTLEAVNRVMTAIQPPGAPGRSASESARRQPD